MINIKELLDDRSKLSAETLPELKELVEKYPFFQVARLLYVANLYQQHSIEFGAELRKASVFVPDRTALFAITEGENYDLQTSAQGKLDIETESDDNRTLSLIDSFLSDKKGLNGEDNTERTQPTITDLTTDYASFLLQQPDEDTGKASDNADEASKNKTVPQLKGGDLIDNFIESTKGKQRFEMPDLQDEDFISPEFSIEDEEIYTESMVNIYIKQGRYQQALEILRKISLNNPKKSANFASQIRLLEIIIKENK